MRILFLDLDTLRPDHLGCYGYRRVTSPNIDAIAAQAVRFEHYYCSDAPCAPSRTALMTGQFGIHNGLVSHGGTAGDVRLEGAGRGFRDHLGSESLPGFLRSCGYRTVSISPFAERHSAWSFYAGFNEMHNTGKCGMESAEEVTPTVLRWLKANAAEDNWFLHLNYWDPHIPFRAPASFGDPFAADPLPDWYTAEEVARQAALTGIQMPHSKQAAFRRYAQGGRHGIAGIDVPPLPRMPLQIETLADVRTIVDGYDCGIRYMDEHVGQVLAALEKVGVLGDTAIIVSSDHGENLGELGVYGDHITADNVTTRIPMIVRWPGGKQGHVDHGLHYHLDLAPTLAALHGRRPPARWDGRSYAPALLDGAECGRSELVVSQCAGTCQRGVRFDNWHYVHTYHDGYNWFPLEMLFDIAADPHEQHDVAGQRRDVCDVAAARLSRWLDDMMASMPAGYSEDPLETVIREGGPSHVRGRLPGYLQLLRDLGRDDAAAELARRHPGEG